MEQKPGWTYTFIDSLGQYIAINEKTGVMYTQDKIFYSKKEQEILRKHNYEIPLAVHLIKKVIGGEIVEI